MLVSVNVMSECMAPELTSVPSPVRVWLIEDSPQWQVALKQWLPLLCQSLGGVDLELCEGSKTEAEDRLQQLYPIGEYRITQHAPHLVLLDWQLTDGYTGLEFGKIIEATYGVPTERILFISEAFPEGDLHQVPYAHLPKSQLMRSKERLLATIQQAQNA